MEEDRILYYNITPVQYLVNSSIVVDPNCNSVTVINIGATIMTVNNIPLNPGTPGINNGESFTFGGNRAEVFSGRIDISFTGGAGSCIVIQKIYIPELCNRNATI
jgi:hypothetical protein